MPRQMPPAGERALRELMAGATGRTPSTSATRSGRSWRRCGCARGPRFAMKEVARLAASIADWCPYPSIRIYLFGSRVRGDHRDDSDVDLCIEITDFLDEAALDWWGGQDFASSRISCPRAAPARCASPGRTTRESGGCGEAHRGRAPAPRPQRHLRDPAARLARGGAAQEERRRRRATPATRARPSAAGRPDGRGNGAGPPGTPSGS